MLISCAITGVDASDTRRAAAVIKIFSRVITVSPHDTLRDRAPKAKPVGQVRESRATCQKFKPKTLSLFAFLVCLKHQMGTISVPMRQSLPESSPK
jgi:hypothetical protein